MQEPTGISAAALYLHLLHGNTIFLLLSLLLMFVFLHDWCLEFVSVCLFVCLYVSLLYVLYAAVGCGMHHWAWSVQLFHCERGTIAVLCDRTSTGVGISLL